MKQIRDRFAAFLLVAVFGLLTVCGCGDGSSSGWVPGVFEPESKFVNLCENPRSGTDPYNNDLPYPDKQGKIADENNWLRSWSNDTYLWYDEIIDYDPRKFDSTKKYFDALKTTQKDPSGEPKDNYHFSMNTAEYRQSVQTGISAGYGAEWFISSPVPPRKILVEYSQKDSPAAIANLTRGYEILEVDGVDVVNDNTETGVETINAGLFPISSGESHTFRIRDVNSLEARNITMVSKLVTMNPVLQVSSIDTPSGKVGYIIFLSFDTLAENQLVEAITQLALDGVTDLVLDLRYNAGGYDVVASQLAYMIAGAAQSSGKTFNLAMYNDKYSEIDPFGGDPIKPLPFIDTTIGLSLPSGQPLPSLNLSRVFVLSTSNTCSASEMVVNSLRGIGVEVILIGGTTCGKPYGFLPTDNCGTTYFTIQIKASNHIGFGDYANGFSPANATDSSGVEVTGCSVADDFFHALGDVNEDLLAVALSYREDATCPVATGWALHSSSNKSRSSGLSLFDSEIYRRHQLIRQNLLLFTPNSPRP